MNMSGTSAGAFPGTFMPSVASTATPGSKRHDNQRLRLLGDDSCINPKGKTPRSVRVLAEGEGCQKRVVEEGDDEHRLGHWYQLQ